MSMQGCIVVLRLAADFADGRVIKGPTLLRSAVSAQISGKSLGL